MQKSRLQQLEDNKALLIGVYRNNREKQNCLDNLEELRSLCDTYGLDAKILKSCYLREFNITTYLGKGKVQEVLEDCNRENISVVVFDEEISPHQQRNLEKILKKTVIDRTELILGVFALHAKTREAKIQIELAQLKYQMPRLKRLWTHLSRQRVSSQGGYLKGSGERQIETDRRLIREAITKLQNKLDEVKKQREIQRTQRKKANAVIFAIVGYTNVGKSTLLNALTNANILVEDKLFATLDTTTRKFTLPNNQEILIVDTVGFINKIPHNLVAAFKSTLEESKYADILLHIVDVSSHLAYKKTCESLRVLKELQISDKPTLTVLNKIDKGEKEVVEKFKKEFLKVIEISALEKKGFASLLKEMMLELSAIRKVVKLKIPQKSYKIASLVMKEGNVLSKEYLDNFILLEAEIPKSLESIIQKFKMIP